MLPTNDFELIERLPSLCLPPLLPPFGFFSALGLLESGLMHVHIYFHVHTNPHNIVSLIWPLFHTSASTYNLFRISILIFDFTWCINHEKASNIHTEVQNTFVKKPEKWIKKRDAKLHSALSSPQRTVSTLVGDAWEVASGWLRTCHHWQYEYGKLISLSLWLRWGHYQLRIIKVQVSGVWAAHMRELVPNSSWRLGATVVASSHY